jgi:galactonate dehydratase
VQAIVRAAYYEWYPRLVTELPPIAGGSIAPPEGPGLGTSLRADVRNRSDASVRTTRRTASGH